MSKKSKSVDKARKKQSSSQVQARARSAVVTNIRAGILRELVLLMSLGGFVFCLISVVTVFLVRETGASLAVAPYVGKFGKQVGTLFVTWLGGGSALFFSMMLGYVIGAWNKPVPMTKLTVVRELARAVALMIVVAGVGWIVMGPSGGGRVGQTIGVPINGAIGAFGAFILFAIIFVVLIPARIVLDTFSLFSRLSCWAFSGLAALGSRVTALLQLLGRSIARLFGLAGGCLQRSLKALRVGWARSRLTKVSQQVEVSPKATRAVPRSSKRQAGAEGAAKDVPSAVSLTIVSSPEVVLPSNTQKAAILDDYRARFENYQPPSSHLFAEPPQTKLKVSQDYYDQLSATITRKLEDFNVIGQVTRVHPGPVITLFEFEPAPGVKVGRITALVDDLAMSLRASSIRILAPIPGQGTVGIEVPNKKSATVYMRQILESEVFVRAKSCLTVPLGQDTKGQPVVADIAKMPHLLIAGATGTGKSVCINSLLMGLLFRASPEELGLILIDPKVLELSIYQDIPHLRVPVVTVAKQARAVLQWAVAEMERRYRLMQKLSVRNIDGFNQAVRSGKVPVSKSSEDNVEWHPLQKIVIVIDELADLMLQVGRDIEELITRLAQKARAAGIHLIVATQRPSVDVITGLIKANFPARLSFRVSSRIDSRTILDAMGAERLLGRGDMLFLAPGTHAPTRIHGAFVSDEEVALVVDHLKALSSPQYDPQILEMCNKALEEEGELGDSLEVDVYDPMYDQAVQLVIAKGQASTSMVQRAFRIGYNRAARMLDMMEREGVVGPMDGSKPREVLVGAND